MIPKSVIDHYEKYKRDNSKFSQQKMMGTKFDIETRYEIIDQSSFFHSFQSEEVLME